MKRIALALVSVIIILAAAIAPRLANAAGEWGWTSANCHPATSTDPNLDCCDLFCIPSPNPTLGDGCLHYGSLGGYHNTTTAGSCTTYTCTLNGGGLMYCGPTIAQSTCTWTASTLSCDMFGCDANYYDSNGHTDYTCDVPTTY